jgi:hypothetical protein
MSYTRITSSNVARINDGLYLSENGTPDMDVLYTAGSVKNGSDYYNTASGSSVTVTAASAGNSKLAIIQKPYNSAGAPTVKDGSEVSGGAVAVNTSDSPTGNLAFFIKVPARYDPVGFRYTNGTGTDYVLDVLTTNMPNTSGITASFTLYAVPDNGSDSPDWANKVFKETKNGISGASDQTWSNLNVTWNNGDKVWFIILGSNLSNTNFDASINAEETAAQAHLLAGVTTISKYSHDSGSSWVTTGWPAETSWKTLSATAPDPAYPTADANNIIIGKVGDTTTPIDENTVKVVEASPGATEVQLIPVNSNRL